MHRASPALREPAAEMRVVEPELVAQHVKQRRRRRGLDGPRLPVQLEGDALGLFQPLFGIGMKLTEVRRRFTRQARLSAILASRPKRMLYAGIYTDRDRCGG